MRIATDWLPPGIKKGVRWLVEPLRYQAALRFQKRENRVYTQFYRFPHQYRTLIERVMPALLARDPGLEQRGLSVAVFACCSGEEVYTLAHALREAFPNLPVRIHGFDIVPEVIEHARTGRYTREQVLAGPFVKQDFVDAIFDRAGDDYVVKDAFRSGTSFDVADMTDAAFMSGLPKFELLFAQNVLFHLPRPVAKKAFGHLVDRLAPAAALFINGMDTDMRIAQTKKLGLEPVDHLVEEIHADARVDRGTKWANQYWGREPFSRRDPDWLRKFGTIYLQGI